MELNSYHLFRQLSLCVLWTFLFQFNRTKRANVYDYNKMIFDYPVITIYRNGNINKSIEVTLRPDMSLVNLINDAMELW